MPGAVARRASTRRRRARRGLLGAIASSALTMPSGRPCVSGFQVVPPSVDLKMPPLVPLPRAVLPRPLPLLPHRRVDDVGVGRIDVDVLAAGVLVLEQDALEGLAAVGRAEDAALLVRARRDGRAPRRRAGSGFFGSTAILRDLLRVAQPEMRPGLAGVGGLVDAVADREIGPLQAFAAADVDDVRDRTARPRPSRSIRSAGRRRSASRCGRRRWSSRRRRSPSRCRRCTAGWRWPAAALVRPARYGPMFRHFMSANSAGSTRGVAAARGADCAGRRISRANADESVTNTSKTTRRNGIRTSPEEMDLGRVGDPSGCYDGSRRCSKRCGDQQDGSGIRPAPVVFPNEPCETGARIGIPNDDRRQRRQDGCLAGDPGADGAQGAGSARSAARVAASPGGSSRPAASDSCSIRARSIRR